MKQNPKSPTFCVLPFIHINAAVTGHFKPCCNTYGGFPDIPRESSFWDAFESKEMDEVRDQVNTGQQPSVCDICWKNEAKGIESQRIHNNRKYREFIEQDKEAKLEYIDVKFDNKCNLQCRMCDPYSSDQIWKTLEAVDKVPGHLKHINITKEEYEKKSFSGIREQDIKNNLDSIKVLKVTGGEPFVSNNFLSVMNKAIETGDSKHIYISVTTNGTKFTKKITEKFKYFKGIDVNISVDGCQESYDYIRYPFTWNKWFDRVVDFLSDMEEMDHPNFKYRFSTVVTAYNYLNLCDTQNALDCIVGMFPGLNGDNSRHVNYFDFDLKPSNSELHAKWLPNEILKHERDKARDLFNIKWDRHPLAKLEIFVDSAMKDYEDYEFEDHVKRFEKRKELLESSIIIDKVRKQDYKVLDPMLVKWMELEDE